MDVLFLTVFVSLVLAGLGVSLFVWSARSRTFEHADRLAILPLEDELADSLGRRGVPVAAAAAGSVQGPLGETAASPSFDRSAARTPCVASSALGASSTVEARCR